MSAFITVISLALPCCHLLEHPSPFYFPLGFEPKTIMCICVNTGENTEVVHMCTGGNNELCQEW